MFKFSVVESRETKHLIAFNYDFTLMLRSRKLTSKDANALIRQKLNHLRMHNINFTHDFESVHLSAVGRFYIMLYDDLMKFTLVFDA